MEMDNKIKFKFVIPVTERVISFSQLQDVIKIVHWRLIAENGLGITADAYGTAMLDNPNPEVFIPYKDITEEAVITWVEQVLDIKEEGYEKSTLTIIKDNLEKEIYLKQYPEVITEPLPTKSNIQIKNGSKI